MSIDQWATAATWWTGVSTPITSFTKAAMTSVGNHGAPSRAVISLGVEVDRLCAAQGFRHCAGSAGRLRQPTRPRRASRGLCRTDRRRQSRTASSRDRGNQVAKLGPASAVCVELLGDEVDVDAANLMERDRQRVRGIDDDGLRRREDDPLVEDRAVAGFARFRGRIPRSKRRAYVRIVGEDGEFGLRTISRTSPVSSSQDRDGLGAIDRPEAATKLA